MLLKDVEKLVENNGDKNFVYPMYDGYSLVNIPNTAMKILGVRPIGKVLDKAITSKIDTRGIKKVVVILIDGFGYDMFLKACRYPGFFKRFYDRGIVAPITSGFPSTTAASVTTMNTGMTPQEHALFEWTLYFKEIGIVINTLPFTTLENRSLREVYSPSLLYKGETVYRRFSSQDVHAYTLIDRILEKSSYNQLFKSHKISISHVKNTDFVIRLREALQKENGKAYFYTYISSVDTSAHAHGPHTEESEAEILSISHAFEDNLVGKIDKKTASETLVIITADHGHTLLNPKKTVYLNRYKKLNKYYARDKNGRIIPPVGSPRDVFLHIKEDRLDEAYEFLSKKFSKMAKVMKISEAIEKGMFGYGKPSKEFLSRVGNILMLPYKNKSIWYEHIKGDKFDMIGMHGGLSKEEVLIPFAAVRLSEIV